MELVAVLVLIIGGSVVIGVAIGLKFGGYRDGQ